MTKEVYNPKEHAEAGKNLTKPKKEPAKPAADEVLHVEEAKPEKTAFINKYGFLHINGKLAKHLGVEFGKDKQNLPVTIEPIERGFTVRLA